MSSFDHDLSRETILGQYLDKVYSEKLPGFKIERIHDLDLQHQGIDIIISEATDKEHFIDEKAQLDYLDNDLPTFAFELSYLKNGVQRLGWLFDKAKRTEKYFLITSIHLNYPGYFESGFRSCRITSVDRSKLIKMLADRGLSYDRIMEIDQQVRNGKFEQGIPIAELDPKSEGKFYFSRSNKVEQPINIILRLDFLIKLGIGKVVL